MVSTAPDVTVKLVLLKDAFPLTDVVASGVGADPKGKSAIIVFLL